MYPLGGDPRSFYSRQSDLTDPGKQAHMYEDLPLAVSGIVRVVQGLIVQSNADLGYGAAPGKEPSQEADTRRVERILERILERIQELQRQPLVESYSPERHLVGRSRDHAVLLTSMLRHRGIPARARCGFARYMRPEMHYARWVCEYWQEREMRWVIVDAALPDEAAHSLHPIRFDPLDVPHTQFLRAGKAWQMCRIWRARPGRCAASGGPTPDASANTQATEGCVTSPRNWYATSPA
ncbi:MAG TPA: transglutaminase-like domain-containing protein [Chloroflexia bacterium]